MKSIENINEDNPNSKIKIFLQTTYPSTNYNSFHQKISSKIAKEANEIILMSKFKQWKAQWSVTNRA